MSDDDDVTPLVQLIPGTPGAKADSEPAEPGSNPGPGSPPEPETEPAPPAEPEPEVSATQQMINDVAARIASGELELPPEAYGEGETSEPLELPPPNKHKWYRCKKGHWQQGEFFLGSRNVFTGAFSWRSGNVCSTCLAQWQAKKFPTAEHTPSAELLARFERMANQEPQRPS